MAAFDPHTRPAGGPGRYLERPRLVLLALACASCAGAGGGSAAREPGSLENQTVPRTAADPRAGRSADITKADLTGNLATDTARIVAAGWRWERSEEQAFEDLNLDPPGEWVEVNGRRLHVVARGTGSPAVLLISGSPEDHRSWGGVQEVLAAETCAISYDRPGLGWSPLGNSEATLDDAIEDVRGLISDSGLCDGPVVLVGHSYGGLVARSAAMRYPALIAGVVLVDPSAVEGIPERGRRELEETSLRFALEEELGWKRLRFYRDHPGLRRELLLTDYHRRRGSTSRRVHLRELRANLAAAPLPRQPGGLGSLPVTVLSTPPVGSPPSELHRRMAALSTAGRFVPVETGHHVHQDDPEVFLSEVRRILQE